MCALVIGGGLLVWPSASQLLRTGHTDVHWSRFVVAMTFLGFSAALVVFWIIDRFLDLLRDRVDYLAGQQQ